MPRFVPGPFLGRFLRLALLVVLVAGVTAVAANLELVHPRAIQERVAEAGALAPVVFVLVFTAGAVLFIPGSVLVLAGGALFGPWLGLACNLAGSTSGAVAAFLVSRYLARDIAERRAGGRLKLIMAGVREEGWRFVLAVRLAGVPFFLLNYMLGLTPIGLGPYAAASAAGMLPAIAAMTYAGHIGFEAVTGGEGVIGKLVLAIALMGVVVLIPVLVRIFRKRRGADDPLP